MHADYNGTDYYVSKRAWAAAHRRAGIIEGDYLQIDSRDGLLIVIDRDGWNQTDVEDLCWALTNRDEDNRLTLSAKQFDWFCSEADWAICEANG